MKNLKRKRIIIQGIVQGVGFRPFVFREAVKENLKGFVYNSPAGVEIEVEGEHSAIMQFIQALQSNTPELAKITKFEFSDLSVLNENEFLIRSSLKEEKHSTLISPDISICNDCIKELFDKKDRRYKYPFINCTNCGPRYSIIKKIPYDRSMTTMNVFRMCPDCQKEYDNPSDRRFHAQPDACRICGPKVWLTDNRGKEQNVDDPILAAIDSLKQGQIVAIKGLGGFHLACDASNEEAVLNLRQRKNREEKPLAVMAYNILKIKAFAQISPKEQDLLLSSRRPIVLLKKQDPNPLAESVAPGNHFFGVILPYTPLHYLIMKDDEFTALVMTSGNISDEPIAIKNQEAVTRLGQIADFFLMNNREIYVGNDDSVCKIVSKLPRFIRRSRGYVPVPVFLRKKYRPVLAVGGELKNTICIIKGDQAFLSQHIGDLENMETFDSFQSTVHHLSRILEIKPSAIAYDLHPDYLSTKWAIEQKKIPSVGIQHHHAHIVSCMAENGYEETVIGLSLDGTGYGVDGTIWGGEIILADLVTFDRIGYFSYRPMPGGSKAIKEIWRMALSYLYEVYQKKKGANDNEDEFLKWIEGLPLFSGLDPNNVRAVIQMIKKKLNVPQTSSLGRLFDGVAAMVGLRENVVYEGQAAIEFEMAMDSYPHPEKEEERGYDFEIVNRDQKIEIIPDKVIESIRKDVLYHRPSGIISLKFHSGLINLFEKICIDIQKQKNIHVVALSGGCFQNRFLLDSLSLRLVQAGFRVLTHSHVPANDGGLALGQAIIAANRLNLYE
jgi:hydrogenase maturation protein HypF